MTEIMTVMLVYLTMKLLQIIVYRSTPVLLPLLVLQSSPSDGGHPTKFWISFFTSFRQLSDAFSLHLANHNASTLRGGVFNCRNTNMAVDKSTSPSSCILNALLMTAVPNRKWHQIAYEACCHAHHTRRFCRPLPSAVLLRKVVNKKLGRVAMV